jgi:hypothetical protein
MTQGIDVTPPDVDRMLKDRVHALTPLTSARDIGHTGIVPVALITAQAGHAQAGHAQARQRT